MRYIGFLSRNAARRVCVCVRYAISRSFILSSSVYLLRFFPRRNFFQHLCVVFNKLISVIISFFFKIIALIDCFTMGNFDFHLERFPLREKLRVNLVII